MELTKFIAYDKWANRKVFDTIQKLKSGEEKQEINKLFAHLLAAQVVWVSRITGEPADLEIWPELSAAEMERFLNENPPKLKLLIPRSAEIIEYSNSKGKNFQNSVEEILIHLSIHGQHHRAQIAKLIRKAGNTPPATDFIFFVRSVHN